MLLLPAAQGGGKKYFTIQITGQLSNLIHINIKQLIESFYDSLRVWIER